MYKYRQNICAAVTDISVIVFTVNFASSTALNEWLNSYDTMVGREGGHKIALILESGKVALKNILAT